MRPVPLEHDGVALTGELHAPDGAAKRPGVLVMHAGLGLGEQARSAAERLRALGYVALASDMFGDFGGDPARAALCFEALRTDPPLLRARAMEWHAALRAQPEVDPARTAAIGYCFGGMCVLELARSGADMRAAISFHGLLGTSRPAAAGAIRGEVAAWCGGHDPYAPQEAVDAFRAEMAAAGASAQITVFSAAEHAFTDPAAAGMNRRGIAYHALADRVSWAGTVALLDAVLDG